VYCAFSLSLLSNRQKETNLSHESATSHILDPTQLAAWFPEVEAFQNPDSFFFKFLSGLSSGMLYTLFFSFCPQLFKAIANYKGNASSIPVAEDNALRYYWIFMLLTAFTGSSLVSMFVSILDGESIGQCSITAIYDMFV
jgi:Calcium-dependent channel, 7TM region, putative phosphate